MKTKLSLLLVLILIISSATVSFAVPQNDKKNNNGKTANKSEAPSTAVTDTYDKTESKNELKDSLKAEKKLLMTKKEALEAAKNQLEIQYRAAVAGGDTELAAQIKTQLDAAKSEFQINKNQIKANISERKRLIRQSYTEKELNELKKAAESIAAEDPDASVLDVDSIISYTEDFKFDMPPVIKSGRTLIPVRAITEGFRAELTWDQEKQEVTITKEEITITLTLGKSIAIVNGEPVNLDVKANMINNRTYVPLRFIMETFNKKVVYDDGTIEIEDGVDDDIYTESAITLN